ncbi:glycoside hydrolase family 2 TIM barrel-domain containing protein [Facklamia hominis]|uniref:glycoside hydrolase family 2 TIM barrel-domain containing protein n=1 Tax=Facklamia hominis TaxID=178214 RepID=UPI00288A1721|nr:glycoside hydrolase family 2 TIM barrel-domain containing protein [Facklamia hominis]
MLLPNYFEDLSLTALNVEADRSYFIPYRKADDFDGGNRRQSSRYIDLNGIWDFHYFENVRHIDQAYWQADCQESLDYDQIPVPSCWQLHGYGQIQYSNTEFPIPYDPPYVPYHNPAGLYHRKIEIDSLEEDYFLNFEGVDSAFYLWLNGQFVGYSQISHRQSEFDLTDYLHVGENDLHILVLQWCDGTYYEDQDKFRYSGIFRDVYLLQRPKTRITDYQITQSFNDDLSQASIHLALQGINLEKDVKISLLDPQGNTLYQRAMPANSELTIPVDQPLLWNAETPYLYEIYLESDQEIIRQALGLRQIEIRDQIFYVNQVPVKLIGVNQHDSQPNTGATVTLDEQIKDLTLMKQYNFNAIRTAHYPKTAEFYELTDRMGFYVISEADIECHGVVDLYGLGGNDNYNMMADDPTFAQQFKDRMLHSMRPFMNYASIVFWSGGNESGYGICIEKMLQAARELDPSRPLHYEAYWYHDRQKTYNTDCLDMWSRMYPSVEEIEELYFSQPAQKPFILCEYIHAMGNGPGDIKAYYDFMMAHDSFIGAFVWEWADHAVNLNRHQPDQEPLYRYGGDHGEYPHAGNFCMDGLMYPDRTPHTGVLDHRQVFRPVKLVSFDQEHFQARIQSYYDFINLKDQVDFKLEVYDQAGQLTDTLSVGSLDCPAQGQAILDLSPYQEACSDAAMLRLVAYQQVKGYELGFDCIQLQAYQLTSLPAQAKTVSVQDLVDRIAVHIDDVTLSIAKESGAIQELSLKGVDQLTRPGYWTIWRAPIDNDRNIRKEWEQANYHHTRTRIHDYQIEESDQGIDIRLKGVLNALARQTILDLDIHWKISRQGQIQMTCQVEKNPIMPFLPRFGMVLPLANDYQSVNYLGNGPHESYEDKHHANFQARFIQDIDDLYEAYVTPQENGAHNQVLDLTVKGSQAHLAVQADSSLSFNLSAYSIDQLTQVAHRDQLQKEDSHYLILDYAQSGTGSNACGPELAKDYQLNDPSFNFSFALALIQD